MDKKILIDGRLLSDKPTGISRYTQELIKSYCLRYGNNSVSVIIDKSYTPEKNDLHYYKTHLKPFSIPDFFRFSSFLRKIDFDLFHAPFYANSFFKVPGKIYITTIHDLMYRVIKDFFSTNYFVNLLAVIHYDFIVKRSLSNSDLLISVSETTRTDVKEAFQRSSLHISEGVNSIKEKYTPMAEDAEYLKSAGLTANGYFLYAGNLRKQKNIAFMLRAFSRSATMKKLVIVGNFPSSDREKYSGYKDERIIFKGFATDRQLSILYRNCAAFIYPSVYEGFGLPVLEALSYPVKVFSSNGGALKEFPASVVNFFNPYQEEELTSLINNESQLMVNTEAINRVLASYNWETLMHHMHEEINKAVWDK